VPHVVHTTISSLNPFSTDRYGFTWEQVPAESRSHLDFGCYQGRFPAALRSKTGPASRLVGVDANREAIEAGLQMYPDVELIHLSDLDRLPFDAATFDSVSLMDVLEHVDDQPALLRELYRVLTEGGRIIVTVPRQHVFSFLDRGNYKFRFPRLHRWFFRLRHSKAEYEHRYVNNPDGLVGDISANKRWHEHFTPEHLGHLLEEAGFHVVLFAGTGLFRRPIGHIEMLVGWIPPVKKLFARFCRWDAKRFRSMNLYCVAVKPTAGTKRD
jgi:SAM-dependent methyltransferase